MARPARPTRFEKGEPVTVQHPNVYPASSAWSEAQTLHIAAIYSNPFRWKSRRTLFNDFIQHMRTLDNVELHVGEVAYGDRPFEVTSASNPLDVQLRASTELWVKESALNAVIQTFPSDWQYGGYVDGDVTITRKDWALEAIHQLQHYDWVQLFSNCISLDSQGNPESVNKSFAQTWIDNGFSLPPGYNPGGWKTGATALEASYGYESTAIKSSTQKPTWVPVGFTGLAWSFTRSAFEAVGGLLDVCILGHADWFMSFGLVYEPAPWMRTDSYNPHYVEAIQAWQEKAQTLKKNIGVVSANAIHHFHGSYKNRGYNTRDQILVKYSFDPVTDIKKSYQGIWELTGNKPGLRDAIREYFLSRNEDQS